MCLFLFWGVCVRMCACVCVGLTWEVCGGQRGHCTGSLALRSQAVVSTVWVKRTALDCFTLNC